MGGGAQELSGPDLEKGIAFASLIENKPLLGHAHGEAVVVVRVGQDVHAIGASCTHYGGPLAEGRVVDGTIRCPWHHACFDLETGQAIGAPALMDVACFHVATEGDLVQVRTKRDAPTTTPKAPAQSPSSVVIVGAGAAGAACVEMLRKEGYAGPIAMFGAEEPGPVDRPNLSKDYLAGTAPEEWIPLGGRERYEALKVDLSANDPIAAIDTKQKTVTTASGKTLGYGALLYATGAEPVRLPIEGATLPHVFTLRSLADSSAIIERAKTAKRAVVIGSSFIGMEVAASLLARGLDVHVVGPDKAPLARVLGDEVGQFIRGIHEAKGTHFHLGTKPKAITDKEVLLETGESLACDLVVFGVGVKPRVTLAEKAGLEVKGGVLVDASLRTSAPDVWAAGDAAWLDGVPTAQFTGRARIEHWVVSERAGQHVAREMLRAKSEAPRPFRQVPFFWSVHHDVTLAYVGFISSLGEVVIHGSLEKRDAAIGYKNAEGKIVAALTIHRDAVSLAVEEAMEKGRYDDIERILAG